MRRQPRDFWCAVGPYITADELVRFHSLPRARFATAHGVESMRAMLARMPSGFDAEFFAEMRHAAWQLRARRFGEAFPAAALGQFYAGVHFLREAGGKLEDVQQFVLCSLSSCVCDGCDLRSGARFDYLGR